MATVSKLLWKIAPSSTKKRLFLSIPPEQATDWLFTYINGNWSIDGGILYDRRTRMKVPYRDIQQYSGVVDHNRFNLVGPFGFDLTVPMIIDGELAPYGQKSILSLSIHTSLFSSLYKMCRSIIGLVLFGMLCAILFWFWAVNVTFLIVMGVLWLLLLGFIFCITYLEVVRRIHREIDLLLNRLISCANEHR